MVFMNDKNDATYGKVTYYILNCWGIQIGPKEGFTTPYEASIFCGPGDVVRASDRLGERCLSPEEYSQLS